MKRALSAGLIALLLSACVATKRPDSEASIGPFIKFSGRLIVIDEARRWQVLIDWNGNPEAGEARLTHAASSRIIAINWSGQKILLRDNLEPEAGWRTVSAQQLQAQGIIMPPQQIARILSGDIPSSFAYKGKGEWEGSFDDTRLHIQWFQENRRLQLTDVSHGRKAILSIDP